MPTQDPGTAKSACWVRVTWKNSSVSAGCHWLRVPSRRTSWSQASLFARWDWAANWWMFAGLQAVAGADKPAFDAAWKQALATGRWDLKPGTREKLARLSGIIVSHPGLRLQVEGYTDNVGSDAMNQRLSEHRATSVRDFLVSQGIADANITAQGFGKTNFVADNRTAAGRQQNRRVELVVSGEIIGTNINAIRTQPAAPVQP